MMTRLTRILHSLLCLTLCATTLTSCIEEYEADIDASDTDLLVVEGTICSGQLNTFYLSRTQALNGTDTPLMVTGATVSVRGTDGTQIPAQGDNGRYTCQVNQLSAGVEYFLHIEVDGEVYESTPQQPLATEEIAEVQAVQQTPQSSIDILVTPEAPHDPDRDCYYQWTYDETWQVEPDYYTSMYFDTELMEPVWQDIYHFPRRGWVDATSSTIMIGASTGYAGHHISQLQLYAIDRADVRMFHRYSALLHQRAISKGEYEYQLARRQAGSEMGGLFTPLPSALPTNVRCLTSDKHVIGFVGCSLNTTDHRFFLNRSEFSIHDSSGADGRLWLEAPPMEDCAKMVSQGLYLCEWDDAEKSPDGKLHTAWAYIHQLDVRHRYEGAYIEKPAFWTEE